MALLGQVLRYSALGLGVFYGFYHQRSITASQRAAAAQREFDHKQQLINKAKEAYAKQKQPAATSAPAAEKAGREWRSLFFLPLRWNMWLVG